MPSLLQGLAACASCGYGYQCPTRRDGQFLDLTDIARAWGIAPLTARTYFHEGRLPEPDIAIGSGRGRKYGWLPKKIAALTDNEYGHKRLTRKRG